MLDLSIENIDTMLQDAAERRDEHLSNYEDLLERYHTSAYEGATEPEATDWLENHPQQYVGLVKSRLVFTRPRIKAWSTLSFLRPVALGLKHGLDYVFENTTSLEQLQRLATDTLFNWGWSLAMLDDAPGTRSGRMIPRLVRLDQRNVIADDLAESVELARFIAHEVRRDKDDLLAEAEREPSTWNLRALKNLPVDADSLSDHPTGQRHMRNEVCVREVYIPELQTSDSPGPENGFNGSWVTLGIAGGRGSRRHVSVIRPPRPAFCHPEGPYTLFGASMVPTKFYPLSPLVAQYHQAAEANKHATAVSRAMLKFRNVVMYDERDRKTAERLKNARDQEWVGIPNLQRGGVVPGQVGGPADKQVEWVGMLLQRLERASGLTTWLQGLMTGDPTATEANIAFTSGSMRFAELEINFEQATAKSCEKLAYLMFHSNEVRMVLGEDAKAELGMEVPVFAGGDLGDGRLPWGAMRFMLEPTSMRKVDESVMQARTLQTVDLAVGLLPVIAQYPSFPWADVMAMVADQLNQPELAEFFTPDVIEAIFEDSQEAMAQQAELGAQGAPQRAGGTAANMGGGGGGTQIRVGGGGQKAGKSNLLGRPQPNTSTDRSQKARSTRSGATAAAKAG